MICYKTKIFQHFIIRIKCDYKHHKSK